MPKAPAIGEEVGLELVISAYRDAPGTTAKIELPAGIELVTGDQTWEGTVRAGSPVHVPLTVIVQQEGLYTITGRALRRVDADTVWGDLDQIFLTVTPSGSSFGFGDGGTEVSAGPSPSA